MNQNEWVVQLLEELGIKENINEDRNLQLKRLEKATRIDENKRLHENSAYTFLGLLVSNKIRGDVTSVQLHTLNNFKFVEQCLAILKRKHNCKFSGG